jgi:Family of unknown function (DUF6535)
MQQNVAMLAQISHQISSIAPQVTIPSTPPPALPTFKPLSSDIRVNVFWFMSLVFSLSAALLAILVQQWVRDYMHVFQRYSDSLKSARLRQYLYEGCEGWYMPVLAEAVPGLLHVSLFLFFVGLVEFILNINTTVGVTTMVPIGISGLFYIFTMFAPVIYPQSPYQNSFSGLIWYVIQKLHGWRYNDRGSGGASKSVSSNMADGQMQLAMEETGERKMRDERAISWLVNNMTEDTEMESLVMAIPGSFKTEWGVEVWRGFSEAIEEENKSTTQNELGMGPHTEMNLSTPMPPSIPTPQRVSTPRNLLGPVSRLVRVRRANNSTAVPRVSHLPPHPSNHPDSDLTPVQRNEAMWELSRRVGHLLETCNNRGHFGSDELWRKRTRACVETAASLVCCVNADLGWFGDIGKVLSDIGVVEKIDGPCTARLDESFVARWTCLSIVAIRPALSHGEVEQSTTVAVSICAMIQGQDGTTDDQALEAAKKIDRDFEQVWYCLCRLYFSLFRGQELTEEQVREKLRSDESQTQISVLERINIEAERMGDLDWWIAQVMRSTNDATQKLTLQLPGVHFDALHQEPESPTFNQALHFLSTRPVSVLPRQLLRGLCSFAPKLRDIINAQGVEECQGTLDSLKTVIDAGGWFGRGPLMERQLARLQDLRNGAGLGFTVELFFATLRKVLPTPSLKESQYALYVGSLKSITSDWEKQRYSLGTQKVILDVVCDLASRLPLYDLPSEFACPSTITDELLVLLRNMFEGHTGPHIDDAVQRLRALRPPFYLPSSRRVGFLDRVLGVISQTPACRDLYSPPA